MYFNLGIAFDDLLNLDGLKKVDQIFLDFLLSCDANLYNQLLEIRALNHTEVDLYNDYSSLIIEISKVLEHFISELFYIKKEVTALHNKHTNFDALYQFKRNFVQRIALKKYPQEKLLEINFSYIEQELKNISGAKMLTPEILMNVWSKHNILVQNSNNQDTIKYSNDILDIIAQYTSYIVHHKLSDHVVYNFPEKIINDNYITDEKINQCKSFVRRDFNYVTKEVDFLKSINEAHYCIYCHNNSKDSCSKGLIQKQDIIKDGCPLKQKISEMNFLKSQGFNIAALAVIIIDNPMVAATGHRICNDCMKACIYQKQDPVNIPLTESEILKTVLKLPYGVEIYLLLTKWNPVNFRFYLPKPPTGYNILIVGLGPAGFTLAHYLLNSGHNIVAVDGIKFNSLNFDINLPIKDWVNYECELSKRIPSGFGGVMEYGITPRWDKNNLTILRLMLERRYSNFKLYSSIRFGSNITSRDAFELGFDHIALCIGAGSPKLLKLSNIASKGIKTSSDFLMTLQSGGAFLEHTSINLMIRMPIAIIGCGLSAIDAAVEAMCYYPIQVKRFNKQYQHLLKEGVDILKSDKITEEEKEITREFLKHAKLFDNACTSEEIMQILDSLGGVNIYYKGKILESSAYKTNYHEVTYAISAGIKFYENHTPIKINLDNYRYIKSIEYSILSNDEINYATIPARSMIIAIGNDEYLDTEMLKQDHRYSYFGDFNPKFAGSVVKAIASVKSGYQDINNKLFNNLPLQNNYDLLIKQLDEGLISKVVNIDKLHGNIIELIIQSHYIVRNFKPGQFVRLQNYSKEVSTQSKPIALNIAYIDYDNNTLSVIINQIGYSTKLLDSIKIGDIVALMGPVGLPLNHLENKNVLIIANANSSTGFISVMQYLKKSNCCVTCIIECISLKDIVYLNKIAQIADKVLLCITSDEQFNNNFSHNIFLYKQDINTVFEEYCINNKAEEKIPISQIICSISFDKLEKLNSIKTIYLDDDCKLITSINAPMQCMMQGICGQCIYEISNTADYIFTCVCKNQEVKYFDFNKLLKRLEQNSLFEKIQKI